MLMLRVEASIILSTTAMEGRKVRRHTAHGRAAAAQNGVTMIDMVGVGDRWLGCWFE